MEYSKISSIELTNFMSYKKAKVSFDETGIINIKGYNDSGKSAILRGLAVCLMDMYKSKQAKFIRHGEEYFRIVVTFDDGISILRDKYINGQSLYEVYKGQERIFTTKQGNRLSRIEGVPKQIEDYLGLCVTDSVYLNYQSCIDKLPVVDTTGSENYQMFHEVLRMEEIYQANNMINLDKNQLGSEIAAMEVELQRNEVLLERCGDVSQEFINEIEKLEKESIRTNNKKLDLDSIVDTVENYSSIKNIPTINKVSSDRISRVYGIEQILSSLRGIGDIPKVEKVSVDRLNAIHNIGKLTNTLNSMVEVPKVPLVSLDRLNSINKISQGVKALESYITIPEIPKVDENLLFKEKDIKVISKVINTVSKSEEICNSIDTELEKTKSRLNEIVDLARKQGMEFVKCDNCGSYTIAGGGHVHG